jgi:hypothetical protein
VQSSLVCVELHKKGAAEDPVRGLVIIPGTDLEINGLVGL